MWRGGHGSGASARGELGESAEGGFTLVHFALGRKHLQLAAEQPIRLQLGGWQASLLVSSLPLRQMLWQRQHTVLLSSSSSLSSAQRSIDESHGLGHGSLHELGTATAENCNPRVVTVRGTYSV